MEEFTPLARYEHIIKHKGLGVQYWTPPNRWRNASYYDHGSPKGKHLSISDQRAMTENLNKVKINFISKTIKYCIYWQNPVKDINEPIRLAYDNSLGQKQIKRIIDKINSHDFIIKQFMINAEHQLNHLKDLIKHLLSDTENNKTTIKQFTDTINKDFSHYFKYYIQLRDYYIRLPEYKTKYQTLFNVVRSGKQCRDCLKYATVKHPKLICEPCKSLKNRKSIIHECPVCLEDIEPNNIIFTRCNGKHVLCMTCHSSLRVFNINKCPLCRGPL